jgi:hypothetical protein
MDPTIDANAMPVWIAGAPPVTGDRAVAIKAIPVRIVTQPADPVRGKAVNALPVFVVNPPPVTGDRAQAAKAIPIWPASSGPPAGVTHPNALTAIPVFVVP